MTDPIRVIQWGCGLMCQLMVKYLTEAGAKLVGAIDRNPTRVGKDAGEISLLKRSLGVQIRHPDEAESVFRQAQADVCIITTRSTMQDCYSQLELAARMGVNAITTGEEAFYPWTTSRDLTKKLDEIAKQNNCTITGSGYQDVFWGHLIGVLAGATHRVGRIEGLTRYNVDDYGSALAQKHGVGLSMADFTATISSSNAPSYVWNSNEWLCGQMGLTVKRMEQQLLPAVDEVDIESSSLKRTIPAGQPSGMKAIVVTETEEGPVIETHCVGKVYRPNETDVNEWTVSGEPDTTVTINRPATPELTCATIVNRLPQLVDAPSGFVTTDQLGPPAYWPRVCDRTQIHQS